MCKVRKWECIHSWLIIVHWNPNSLYLINDRYNLHFCSLYNTQIHFFNPYFAHFVMSFLWNFSNHILWHVLWLLSYWLLMNIAGRNQQSLVPICSLIPPKREVKVMPLLQMLLEQFLHSIAFLSIDLNFWLHVDEIFRILVMLTPRDNFNYFSLYFFLQ